MSISSLSSPWLLLICSLVTSSSVGGASSILAGSNESKHVTVWWYLWASKYGLLNAEQRIPERESYLKLIPIRKQIFPFRGDSYWRFLSVESVLENWVTIRWRTYRFAYYLEAYSSRNASSSSMQRDPHSTSH